MSTNCSIEQYILWRYIPTRKLAWSGTVGICICLLVLTSGCVTVASFAVMEYAKDVTRNPAYAGGYKPGADYELLVDSFVYEDSDWRKKQLFLEAPEQFRPPGGSFSSPQSIEMYHAEREKWQQIKGILAKGTKI